MFILDMKKTYNKPFLNFAELIQLLKDRGMVIADEKQAINELATIGYYRLSAYSYPFRKNENGSKTDDFQTNTNWQKIIDLYHFDKKLRILVMDAIEWVEVVLRAQITHSFAKKYTAFGYLDKNNFNEHFKHEKWIEHIQTNEKKSKNVAIKHFQKTYTNPHLPLWVLIETVSFGSLSRFYSGLKIEDKKVISGYFKENYKTIEKWLHTLAYVRNICAHHNRLWNVILDVSPKKLIDIDIPNNKIYIVLMILTKLLAISNKQKTWEKEIYKLIIEIYDKYPESRIFEMMGMVEKNE